MGQELSARDFVPGESPQSAGILDVFFTFQTARMGQKIRRKPQFPLCGAALSVLQYGYLVISGIFAISSMLLPGISGSTLLLILGVYVPAISAVKELLQFHLQYLSGVVALAVGIVIGITFTAKFIRKALRSFRPQMIYLILGLMLGSLYAILMGPTTLNAPKPPVDFSSFHVIAFLIGTSILCGLEIIKRHITHIRAE